MYNFISSCPSCGGELHISTLQCGSCGLEIKKDFEVSVFDKLSDEQISFLLSFLVVNSPYFINITNED